MRAVIFRYPPHTRIFLSAHFWLRHRRQAETWITLQYGRRTSFKSDSIGRDSQYEESNVRAIFPTHNPTHNSRSLVGLTSILAVPCCKTDNRSAVALEEEAIPIWLLSPVVVIGLFPHFSRLSTHRQVPVIGAAAQRDVIYRIPEVPPEGRVTQETPVLIFPQ